jgi:hypothetical protein
MLCIAVSELFYRWNTETERRDRSNMKFIMSKFVCIQKVGLVAPVMVQAQQELGAHQASCHMGTVGHFFLNTVRV